jgi:ADP-ribose pyrophosphatase YjhB (NUDIX family)
MHKLQQHILHQLIRHPDRRYADLKPTNTEGNLFMYHLRKVMSAGWVTKRSDGQYILTPEGQRYVDGLSLKTLAPRIQPRIVTLIACQNKDGEWLFLRRKRQPLLGTVGFPYGKIHLGETVAEAAARELAEKTGLVAQLQHRGDGYITICEQGEPVSQIMFHLFYGRQAAGELRDSAAGPVFWAPISARDDSYLPSVLDLIRLIQEEPDRFFVELTYQL